MPQLASTPCFSAPRLGSSDVDLVNLPTTKEVMIARKRVECRPFGSSSSLPRQCCNEDQRQRQRQTRPRSKKAKEEPTTPALALP
ncbi:hypothetical protein AUP68_12475 [Ilyonectria robusta]